MKKTIAGVAASALLAFTTPALANGDRLDRSERDLVSVQARCRGVL